MNPFRTTLSVLWISALLGTASASAATDPAQPESMRQGRHHGPGGPDRGFRRVLEQLNLTGEQKTQIQSLVAQAKPAMDASQQSGHANREQLLITPPTDPSYAGLVAFAKTNAADQIQHMSNLWSQVYGQLTEDQRARIPGIVASANAERDARKSSKRSQPIGE